MRQFYLTYKDFPNLQQLVGEIPWGQNLVIMSRVKDYKEKEFYIRKTSEYGWTRMFSNRQLEITIRHLEISIRELKMTIGCQKTGILDIKKRDQTKKSC